VTGLDYADQRYYASTYGRFNTPDPSRRSAKAGNPLSWNRYAYTLGDPVNGNDPKGLDDDDDEYGIDGCGECQNSGPDQVVYGYSDPSASGTGAVITTTLSFQSADGVAETTTYSSIQGFSTPGSCGMTNTGLSNEIWTGSITWNLGWLGAMAGGLGGPEGVLPGALVGSMCGFGFSGTYVPSTGSYYGGVVASCGIVPLGGGGASAAFIPIPRGQDPNAIANGPSGSITFLPTGDFAGSTVVKSPGSGPPVVGVAAGFRAPISVAIGVNGCVRNCTTP